jgi:hypothetical protein
VSDGNQGSRPESPTPVTDEDWPTAEMAPVGRPGTDGSPRPGQAAGPAPTPPAPRPAGRGGQGSAPAKPGTAAPASAPPANGQGPKGQPASRPAQQGGQRPATPQPTASGWTPPPLPGRQTPQPPAPRPAEQQRTGSQPSSAPGGTTRPAAPQPAGPRPAGAGPAPQGRPGAAGPAATNRPGGLPLPTPAPARPTAAASEPAVTEETSPAADTTAATPKPSLWQRVTDGLGIERKPARPAPGPETSDASASAPPTASASTTTKPTSGPQGAPVQAGAASGAPSPALAQYRPDGRTGGPQDRLAPTRPSDPRPGQPGSTPGSRPGGAAPAATALVPAAAGAAAGATAGSQTEVLAGAPKPHPTPARRTRKARLRLSRLDPWSVMKTSFLFSIAAGIMLVVAVYAVWTVLSASGLFTSVNDIISIVVSTPGDTTPFQVEDYVSTQRVMGVAALIACVDVVIFTALATLGSFLYNLAATMLGGLEITLAED